MSQAAQAYKLFSDGKSAVDVAIALNLRQAEVTEFYREYWKLEQLYDLSEVYEEIKGDIHSFVNLYRLSKTAGMNTQQVVNLLNIANNHLPAVKQRAATAYYYPSTSLLSAAFICCHLLPTYFKVNS